MMNWLDVNQLLVKEHVGFFKAANNFDIFDLATGTQLLTCREPSLGPITKLLRFSDYKRMTPFRVELRDAAGEEVVRVSRGISIMLSRVAVHAPGERLIGGFKQKLFSIGGRFTVLDEADEPLCELKGKWTGWNFSFSAGDFVMATVKKKWAGSGREFFTSADNYVIDINPEVTDHDMRRLILAATMCIDMVLKE